MIELDERLRQLADSVDLPRTSPEDDLARGRARRRHRNLGAAGAALTTAAVIGTSVLLFSSGTGREGANPDFAGGASSPTPPGQTEEPRTPEDTSTAAEQTPPKVLTGLAQARSPRIKAVLAGYRDILREDLDPTGAHLQSGPITNEQGGDDALGTKLTWNGGGMLQVAVGRSLDAVQFFCDGACAQRSVAGGSKALVLAAPGRISVAVYQDDGDIVALTADTSFGNNGTSTHALGLTVDQLLTAAADPRLDLPAADRADQPSGLVGTQ